MADAIIWTVFVALITALVVFERKSWKATNQIIETARQNTDRVIAALLVIEQHCDDPVAQEIYAAMFPKKESE